MWSGCQAHPEIRCAPPLGVIQLVEGSTWIDHFHFKGVWLGHNSMDFDTVGYEVSIGLLITLKLALEIVNKQKRSNNHAVPAAGWLCPSRWRATFASADAGSERHHIGFEQFGRHHLDRQRARNPRVCRAADLRVILRRCCFLFPGSHHSFLEVVTNPALYSRWQSVGVWNRVSEQKTF